MSTRKGSSEGAGRPRSGEGARERAQRVIVEKARQRRRERLIVAGIASVAVVAIVLTMVIVSRFVERDTPEAAPVPSGEVANSVATRAASVPATVLDQVGVGDVLAKPVDVTDQGTLSEDGKPLIVYIGAEYCPYCASQRWPVVVALSRFGTFSDLGMTHSASDDVYPNTQSFSFHGSSYTSEYLAFQGVELSTNERDGSGYGELDTLTEQQAEIMETLNAPPYVSSSGGIPFMDMGNQYVLCGGAYNAELLQGKTAEEIVEALSDPNDSIARAILGTANMITAYTCQLTGGQPGDVCESDAVKAFDGVI